MDREQQKELARKAAFEAGFLRANADIPPAATIDPVDLATQCKCNVRFLSLPSLEGVYSPEPRPLIVLGSERPAGRRIFNCAHELGHHVFKHGVRIEELGNQKLACNKLPEEFLADAFAGFLLMPQSAVRRTLKDRGWTNHTLDPEQVYRLASFFGVGYGTVINHFTWSLGVMTSEQADKLLKVKPKLIKERYGASPDTEIVFMDLNWAYRAVDLQVGDIIVVPSTIEVELGKQLQFAGTRETVSLFRATSPGYTRAHSGDNGWAVNIRVARKNYEGLAQYRFFEEMEGEQ